LKIFDDDGDINEAWESIKENIEASSTDVAGYYELKQHKNGMIKSD
jgi:hypothetical protein